MRNKIVLIFTYSLTLLVTGCIQPYQNSNYTGNSESTFYKPSEAEKASADYGKYPDNFEKIIKERMQTVLKDPESARYRFDSPPKKSNTVAKNRQDMQYCWIVFFFVNAKNSYGGYTGDKLGDVCIRNGQIIDQSLPE